MATFDEDPFDQHAAAKDWARAQRPQDTRAAAVERGEIPDRTPTASPRPAASSGPRRAQLLPAATRAAGGSVSGVLVGFIAYALFLSYIRQGPAGPAMWFKAKFFNETGTPAAAAAPAAAPAVSPIPAPNSVPAPLSPTRVASQT